MKDEDVAYIAKRYHKGRFSADEGWRRLGISSANRLRRLRIAAAVASAIVLTATAAVIFHQISEPTRTEIEVRQSPTQSNIEAIRAIDFENAQLPAVAAEIRRVYCVEVVNLPENAAEYRLSLHFEGNPVDLVETINDILGTNLAIKQ